MYEKFIYVFNEDDKNALLARGYELIQEPKQKKASTKKKTAKGKEAEVEEDVQEEVKYWVFLNKQSRDVVFNSLGNYCFSNQLNF